MVVRRTNNIAIAATGATSCNNNNKNNSWLVIRIASILVFGLVSYCWIRLSLPLLLNPTSNEVTATSKRMPSRNAAVVETTNKTVTSSPARTILEEEDDDDDDDGRGSPACRPHFHVARPDGTWTDASKITTLYFYHVRKAGVSKED